MKRNAGWSLGRRWLAACLVVSFAALSFGSAAQASMTVSSTGDSGGCSLRSVIAAVEAGTSGACGTVESPTTTINLPANTITLSSQLVVNQGNMAIVGNENAPTQTVISGGGHDRVMEVKSSATVKLVGLEITKGRAHNAPTPLNVYEAYPGENGGGILNKGSLTLEHSLVTENMSGIGASGLNSAPQTSGGSGSEGGSGGGIYSTGSLSIYTSTISKNVTGGGGNGGPGGEGEVPAPGHYPNGLDGGAGGPAGDGGGIFNTGSLYIEDSTITENATGRGGNGGSGGLGAGASGGFGAGRGGDGGEGGNSSKQYQKNTGYYTEAERGGGGIYNYGSLTMLNSTIAKNNTGAGGNGGPSGSGGQRESNGFETSGRAGIGGGAGRGGGLVNAGSYGHNASAHLTNVTVFGNLTGQGGNGGGGGGGAADTLGGGAGGYGGDGGGIFGQGPGSELVLMNVTVAGNAVNAGGLGGSSPEPKFVGAPGVRGVGAGIAAGGRYNTGGSGIYLKNSIVAGNGNPASGDTNCHSHYYPEQYLDFYDQGNNVTFPGGGSTPDTFCPGTVADPGLGTFGNNGGPTQTLVPSGAAIGIVPLAACTVHEDQRGDPRPGIAGKGACDAGAVETSFSGETTLPGGGGSGGGGSGGGTGTGTGGAGGGGGSGAGTPAPAPKPESKPLKCKKGFVKKAVKGKPACVKLKHRHRHHH